MSDFLVYGLFILAGFFIGGAYSMWKTNKFFFGVLVALAVLATAGGVLRLI